MALLKVNKKNDKKAGEPIAPKPEESVAEIALAMSGQTTLALDEKSEKDFCFAMFQTLTPLSAEDWVKLACAGNAGYKFTLVVTKDDGKKEQE